MKISYIVKILVECRKFLFNDVFNYFDIRHVEALGCDSETIAFMIWQSTGVFRCIKHYFFRNAANIYLKIIFLLEINFSLKLVINNKI